MTEQIDVATSALVLMDFQKTIVEMAKAEDTPVLDRAAALLAAARQAGMPVVHVVVGFRPGYPEVSPDNKSFSVLKTSDRFGFGSPGTLQHPRLAAQGDEPVVVKHRTGSFQNTDLEIILRAHGARTLVMAGISTSGCVLSTVRYAADADYRIYVAQDCCMDGDGETHRVLMEKIFPKQATVLDADALIAALR